MGKAINLLNQRFGRWTVIERDTSKHNDNYAYWYCICDCGIKKSVRGRDLRNGSSKSCGCLSKELSSQRNVKNLIGQKFGKLTVIKRDKERHNGGNAYWFCDCDCGNKNISVRGSHLINGETKQCRQCINLIDISGEINNNLEALSYNFKEKKWNVKCLKCGLITLMDKDNFYRNFSCGCIKSQGEYQIGKLLNENNIAYVKEKIFDDCIFSDSNKKARFDFYVEDKYLIEFDGEQHFKEGTGHFNNKEKFNITQRHDEYKNKWCQEKKIPLIRIPYTHLNSLSIEDLLLETTSFLLV